MMLDETLPVMLCNRSTHHPMHTVGYGWGAYFCPGITEGVES